MRSASRYLHPDRDLSTTGEVAHTGQVTSQVSYDAANDPYAGIAARQDSQQRAATDAARRILVHPERLADRSGASLDELD